MSNPRPAPREGPRARGQRTSRRPFDTSRLEPRDACRGLPPSYLSIHSAEGILGSLDVLSVDSDLFVGVTVFEGVSTLGALGRRLPFEQWRWCASELLREAALIPEDHSFWRDWPGPRGFGIDVDGALRLFPSDELLPWTRAEQHYDFDAFSRTGPQFHRSACLAKVLAWLLEGYRLSDWRVTRKWEGRFTHPELSEEVKLLLEEAIEGGLTLPRLRQRLGGAEPAAGVRAKGLFFGACPEALQKRIAIVEASATELPRQWMDAGLRVLVDQALESEVPVKASTEDPLVIAAAGGQSLGALTRTGELKGIVEQVVATGRKFVRNLVITRATGIPRVIQTTRYGTPPPGARLVVTLTHPMHPAARVELDAVAGKDASATIGAPKNPAQLKELLSSLVHDPSVAELPGQDPAARKRATEKFNDRLRKMEEDWDGQEE